MSKKDAEVKFAVVAADGRRSSVWRAFTRGNETYLSAASSLGRVKVSLHGDGNCFHVLEPRVRELLPPGPQRAALDKWTQLRANPGDHRPAYMVGFSSSELLRQDDDLPSDVSTIPAEAEGQDVFVVLSLAEPPLREPSYGGDLRHLARLPLRRGAAADLGWTANPARRQVVEAARDLLYNAEQQRVLPEVLSTEPRYAYAFGELPMPGHTLDGLRCCVEVATSPSHEARLLMPGDPGELSETTRNVAGSAATADDVSVLGERYVRLPRSYRQVIEGAGPPVYVRDDLLPMLVSRSEQVGGRSKEAVTREVLLAVQLEADGVVGEQGGMPLMSPESFSPEAEVVVAYAVLVRPAGDPAGDAGAG